MIVVVTSNCQTGGISAALRGFFAGATVIAFPYPEAKDDAGRERLLTAVETADWWVVSSWFLDTEIAAAAEHLQHKVIRIPDVFFDGYHPDLVYVWRPDGSAVEGAIGPYQSAIVLWAWRHGLGHAATMRLFAPHVVEALGYTRRWRPAVDRLIQDFAAVGLDGRELVLRLQNGPPFMHSVNHPRIGLLVEVARQLAARIGTHDDDLARALTDTLVDGLQVDSFVWPVYPPIAERFGMRGSYLWKGADQRLVGLPEFVETSLQAFDGTGGADLSCAQLEWPFYDEILGAASEVDAS